MAPTAKQFLAVAASQIGTMEGRDPNGNWNNDNKYGRWYGTNREAWCGIFVSWCANEVGGLGSLVPKYSSCWAGLSWFRARNQTGVWPPQPGDVFIVRYHSDKRLFNSDPDGWTTKHTGIVERWHPDNAGGTTGYITTIEGNTNNSGTAQGNGVYRLIRRDSEASKALLYCRPNWGSAPAGPKKSGGQSAPIHVTTKPAHKAKAQIRVSHLHKDAKNDPVNNDVIQLNRAVWKTLGKENPAYRKAHVAAWAKESEQVYGWESAEAVYALYKALQKKYPQSPDWATLPSHSKTDWATPGPKLLATLGFDVLPG